MPQNKRQHFVPKFYLKRFSNDGKSINIWNIKRKQKFCNASLKNQCYGNYFYGKDPVIEQALSTIEASNAGVLRSIGETSTLPRLGSEEHQFLALYILMQHSRTLHMAEELEEMTDKLAKHLLKDSEALEGIDLNNFRIGLKEPARSALSTAISSYPLLFDLDYKLLVNRTNTEFITSDNPVVFYNQLMSFRKDGSNTGLAAKGLEIFLPTDPGHMILFYDDNVYQAGTDTSAIVYIDRNRDAEQLNLLQICSASENLYFRNKFLDMEALHGKGIKFRSEIKSDVQVVQSDSHENGGTRELVRSSRIDVNTNLSLRFLNIKYRAKRWRSAFKKMRVQPVSIIRNERLRGALDDFEAEVKKGNYTRGQFFKFWHELTRCGH